MVTLDSRQTRDSLTTSLIRALSACGQTLAVAESCTGGLLGARLTSIPGASRVLRGGLIAYADSVKSELLGVPDSLLAAHGAVSEPVARAMAEGASKLFRASCALSTTGIAGPGGGTPDKPVGTVFIGAWTGGHGGPLSRVRALRLPGNRDAIRDATVDAALVLLDELLAELLPDDAPDGP